MKRLSRLLILTILMACLSTFCVATISLADEGSARTENPGDEPNNKSGRKAPIHQVESNPAKTGHYCEVCEKNLDPSRYHRHKNKQGYAGKGSGSSGESKASPTGATK
ncbi:MAG: hypothetical protein ACXVCY_11705 [Pseudobdellovibrionaceae bacterium]